MRNYNVLRSREKTACMGQIQAAIGRQLRAEYGPIQPMPDDLADLLRQFTRASGAGEPESE